VVSSSHLGCVQRKHQTQRKSKLHEDEREGEVPGQHAPSLLLGAAKAMWQQLAGIPKPSSQLQRLNRSWPSAETLAPAVGQHQTATGPTEHQRAGARGRWPHRIPVRFPVRVRRSAMVWISPANSCGWPFQ